MMIGGRGGKKLARVNNGQMTRMESRRGDKLPASIWRWLMDALVIRQRYYVYTRCTRVWTWTIDKLYGSNWKTQSTGSKSVERGRDELVVNLTLHFRIIFKLLCGDAFDGKIYGVRFVNLKKKKKRTFVRDAFC